MSLQMPPFSAKDLDVDILLALDPMQSFFFRGKQRIEKKALSLVFGGVDFERRPK